MGQCLRVLVFVCVCIGVVTNMGLDNVTVLQGDKHLYIEGYVYWSVNLGCYEHVLSDIKSVNNTWQLTVFTSLEHTRYHSNSSRLLPNMYVLANCLIAHLVLGRYQILVV